MLSSVLDGHVTIESRQPELDKLYLEIFGEEDEKDKATARQSTSEDNAIIRHMLYSKNRDRIKLLWDGSTIGYKSQSEADQAFCNHLAFWTQRDPAQMDRIFRQSKLMRPKWDEGKNPSYGERTIAKAIAGCKEVYKSPPPIGENLDDIMYEGVPLDQQIDHITGEDRAITEEEFQEKYGIAYGPDFKLNLPKDHFLMRYMAYGYDVSDGYPEYWFIGGLHALATVNDKKIFVKLRQMSIYCNLYLAMLGKSTIARKSTISDKTEDLLMKVWPFLINAKVPTEFSPEAFIEHMNDYPHCPWIRDEAAGVLNLMKRDYMRGFKETLMTFYDCRAVHRKLRTSQRKNSVTDFNVDDPYLNILFATTPESFAANTELIDTLSGFLARLLYALPQRPK